MLDAGVSGSRWEDHTLARLLGQADAREPRMRTKYSVLVIVHVPQMKNDSVKHPSALGSEGIALENRERERETERATVRGLHCGRGHDVKPFWLKSAA